MPPQCNACCRWWDFRFAEAGQRLEQAALALTRQTHNADVQRLSAKTSMQPANLGSQGDQPTVEFSQSVDWRSRSLRPLERRSLADGEVAPVPQRRVDNRRGDPPFRSIGRAGASRFPRIALIRAVRTPCMSSPGCFPIKNSSDKTAPGRFRRLAQLDHGSDQGCQIHLGVSCRCVNPCSPAR